MMSSNSDNLTGELEFFNNDPAMFGFSLAECCEGFVDLINIPPGDLLFNNSAEQEKMKISKDPVVAPKASPSLIIMLERVFHPSKAVLLISPSLKSNDVSFYRKPWFVNSIKASIMVVGQTTLSLAEMIPQEDVVNKIQSLDKTIPQEDIVNKKPHLEILPNLEEHDNGETGFQISFNSSTKNKHFQSNTSKKIYIRANDNLSVQVQYRPISDARIRVTMVFDEDISEPVVRCENHSSKDQAKEENIKYSVLRCKNAGAAYYGKVKGKNISDRLSICLPWSGAARNNCNMIKQNVELMCVCQNSCVSRRSTSIIFLLETNNEILAQRVIGVKICSCPKRDMKNENMISRKRTNSDECPNGKKIIKLDSKIKLENGDEHQVEEASFKNGELKANEIHVKKSGSVKLTLMLPNKETADHVMNCAYNALAGQMAKDPSNKDFGSYLRLMEKFLDENKKLDSK